MGDLMKPPIAPPGVGANGSSQQLQHLTNQIAEQLRVTVAKGLIDPFVLNQTLSKRTLLLLNNLLQRVPKLESVCSIFILIFQTLRFAGAT
jgi:hypothetical protein